MEKAKLDDVLFEILDEDAREFFLGAEPKEIDAPLDNFFGDDWLTLLYIHEGPCSDVLQYHRENLKTVADKKAPREERINAAIELGNLVSMRGGDGHDIRGRGVSRPTDWFRFARQLGSVDAALAYANALLDEGNLTVHFDREQDLLPQLDWKIKEESTDAPRLDPKVCEAWQLGARVALRHMQRRFDGWSDYSFGCAFACIVNYLTLLPARRLGSSLMMAERRKALVWIKPLWKRLIADASKGTGPGAKKYRTFLLDQRLAVLMLLEDREQSGDVVEKSATSLEQLPSGNDRIVVIRGTIPDSSERSEKDYLKQYEPLRRPVALTSLPGLSGLEAIRRTLEAEFPWAEDAIDTVLSDLLARRRHGAMRLGMAPILLAGPPGTGKTRFAQRLSDLLSTPNTVINLAGMSDVKLLKGVTRGWASNRPSRMLEFILQTRVANPLFVLDEIDKAGSYGGGNGGDPQEALLDLLEPGNAKRYQDIYLMTECDVSHCLYVATSNSLERVPEPLLSRLRPVFFPAPGPEHTESILRAMLADMARSWGVPEGAVTVQPHQVERLRGLAPREMRSALLDLLGRESDSARYTLH